MAEEKKTTSAANGRLWGSAAADWAEIQEGMCRPVYLDVFERIGLRSGMRYLDAGCGAGMAAQIARERGAQVSGLDASENLLEVARQRVPDGDFRQGELESLPFADDSFDVVTGFNSFQYAGDRVAALGQAKRVAKPGATVVVMTWGRPEGMEAASLVAALKPLLPAPPPGAPGPFALSDEAALRGFAESAELKPVGVFDVDCPWHYPDLQAALRGLGSSGVAAKAIENSSKSEVDEAHEKALAPFRQADGSYKVGSVFRYLVARG
ncbi:MAG TPA: class I SAM-dependent methyltransferase [Acidobacteriaceae bacterium]|jgi:SAM-dependent methyltransferase|nr:class I SAM-dependent methyltransferase [Acidobacteriaceae bacterium]